MTSYENQNTGVVVIIKQEERFLLVRQNKHPYRGYWAPVHGAVEQGGTEEEAVIRETREEIGLLVKPLRKLKTSKADYKVDKLHWWIAEYQSGDVIVDKKEISEYGYFTLRELLALKLLPETKKFFEQDFKNLYPAQ